MCTHGLGEHRTRGFERWGWSESRGEHLPASHGRATSAHSATFDPSPSKCYLCTCSTAGCPSQVSLGAQWRVELHRHCERYDVGPLPCLVLHDPLGGSCRPEWKGEARVGHMGAGGCTGPHRRHRQDKNKRNSFAVASYTPALATVPSCLLLQQVAGHDSATV